MSFFRCAYSMQTRHVLGWDHPRAGQIGDVLVMVKPGYSPARVAGALRRIAAEIASLPDPNATGGLPVAHYHADTREEISPVQRTRHHAAAIG